MRDFRDAKAMAQTIRATLAAKGHKISIGESLELIARAFGAADWNTLTAAIRADKAAPAPTPAPTPAFPPTQSGSYFSPALDEALHRSVSLAQTRSHSYVTLEHLLLALTDDPDASAVLGACQVDLGRLRKDLTRYVDYDLLVLVTEPRTVPAPTAGFHRVVQRAVIHVRSSGREVVTGANVLVAIFSEAESHACLFLTEQGVTRSDAVNFIAHGIRKGDAAA